MKIDINNSLFNMNENVDVNSLKEKTKTVEYAFSNTTRTKSLLYTSISFVSKTSSVIGSIKFSKRLFE